ncbi:MAG: DUF192 domain-containing protein [Deltaproteobacteria bacterium]|nr:DUF192 domain-containing protein [Deltaproteobacteria bacterium]
MLRLLPARTWHARLRGLAGRESLEGYDGMLFTFPFAWRWPIWMRGMRFPIRAVWLRQGHVVDVQDLPLGAWRWYRPRAAADAVVEMPLRHKEDI